MKRYLISLMALAVVGLTSSFGAVATFNPTSTAAVSVVPAKNGAISTLTFVNNAVSATTITMVDAPSTALTYTIGAYTNNVVTTGTQVVTFTNILGTVQSQTNAVIISTPTAVASSSPSYPTLLAYVIPASTTTTVPFNPAIYFSSGLNMAASATNCVVTVNYQSAK